MRIMFMNEWSGRNLLKKSWTDLPVLKFLVQPEEVPVPPVHRELILGHLVQANVGVHPVRDETEETSTNLEQNTD